MTASQAFETDARAAGRAWLDVELEEARRAPPLTSGPIRSGASVMAASLVLAEAVDELTVELKRLRRRLMSRSGDDDGEDD